MGQVGYPTNTDLTQLRSGHEFDNLTQNFWVNASGHPGKPDLFGTLIQHGKFSVFINFYKGLELN